MKLKRFNPENCGSVRTGAPTIGFNRKSGVISISREAVGKIELKEGDKVEILQSEEDDSEWYLVKSKNGFELRPIKGTKGGLGFNNTGITKKLLESMEADDLTKSMKFQLATEPTVHMTEKLFAIITLNKKT